MATIVTHKEEGGRYLLLGGGYASDRIERPHWLLGDSAPSVQETNHSLMLIANETGEIGWVRVDEMRLLTIDGFSAKEALAPQDRIEG